MTILEFVFWSLLKIIVVTVVLLLGVAYTVLLERKLVGRIQNRWGPSRVGPFGLLQPLVDGAKNFLKEDIIPTGVYRPLYLLAPILSLGCAMISIAVVPFGSPTIATKTGSASFRYRTSTSGCWWSLASRRSACTESRWRGGRRTTSIRCWVRCAPQRN